MEGPYRDLGSGFARLTGVEGARRGPSRLSFVEDALTELLRNARDAGAQNVFVASILTRRRYRTITVIDDGRGIPKAYADLVFEPGVTTRHLDPVRDNPSDHAASSAGATGGERAARPHGAGLALYHLKLAAVDAAVLSPSSPTALRATFDTSTLPERTLQSSARTSRSNLLATAQAFVRRLPADTPRVFYGPPARTLATLLDTHIILTGSEGGEVWSRAEALGLGVSRRTVQRVLRGEIRPLAPLDERGEVEAGGVVRERGGGEEGPSLVLGPDERADVAAILSRAARAGYLEVEDLRVESRPGEIVLRARVYEPEDEYE